MKNVKNNASPINTWFGGICCVASDVLTKDKTIIILVKLVINMSIAGANDRIVNNNNNLTEVDTADGSDPENISTNSFIIIFPCFMLVH